MISLPDHHAFLELIERSPSPEARALFDKAREVVIARAPGRLDLMGGIADYSGSLVLQWPIREATWVALQPARDKTITVVSLGEGESGRETSFSLQLSDLQENGAPVEYERAQRLFNDNPASHWAAYVVGAFLVLMRERGVQFTQGARILVASEIPEGKGVSSSAAIEVAAMQALAAAFDIPLTARELALLCQRVENRVVGAPCGVMDQMTSACGEAGSLLALLCQPAELLGTVALPGDLAIWGLDSGVRHSVAGGDYGTVRTAAFMGLKIIQQVSGRDWGGYLANITPSEYAQRYLAKLPEQTDGGEFIARYGRVDDPLSDPQPGRIYPTRAATTHPINENFRVRAFRALLESKAEQRGSLLGELMYQSHASYSACGLGSEATDRLVSLVRESGESGGLYGAKITGGGSGGTVAVLGNTDAEAAIQEIIRRYADETGYEPYPFTGSSPGAAKYGTVRARLAC